jgi:hypothetical protein
MTESAVKLSEYLFGYVPEQIIYSGEEKIYLWTKYVRKKPEHPLKKQEWPMVIKYHLSKLLGT